MQFDFVLKNEKIRRYDRLAIAIILINIFAFFYFAFTTGETKFIIPAILLTLSACSAFYFKRVKQRITFHFSFLIITFTWLALSNYWIAIITGVLEMLYTLSTRTQVISFNKEHILYPGVPRRKIRWSEADNVMLKDGLLTVDLKNNRILQSEIEYEDGMTIVDESIFNIFCAQQLKTSGTQAG